MTGGHEHRGANASAFAGIDVSPAITDHDAAGDIINRRTREKPGLGLTTVTSVPVVVIANPELVDREVGRQRGVDGLDGLKPLRATCNVGLIGHDDEREPGGLQLPEGILHTRKDLERVDGIRRPRNAVADVDAIQDAIPVEKHRR